MQISLSHEACNTIYSRVRLDASELRHPRTRNFSAALSYQRDRFYLGRREHSSWTGFAEALIGGVGDKERQFMFGCKCFEKYCRALIRRNDEQRSRAVKPGTNGTC